MTNIVRMLWSFVEIYIFTGLLLASPPKIKMSVIEDGSNEVRCDFFPTRQLTDERVVKLRSGLKCWPKNNFPGFLGIPWPVRNVDSNLRNFSD